jgi:glycosyltransferase involved in cell wall biosynthesis
MPVLNEADILPWSIRHLQAQGVKVHVIDGWSTDGSLDIASELGATVEKFPQAGPESKQVCSAILNRIEQLAAKSPADWCYYTDADEIRRAPQAGETLVDAIKRVDAEGWNVVDHQAFTFIPQDEGYRGQESPEVYFRYFTDSDGRWTHISQQKLWKNDAGITFTEGGHKLARENKRLCPEKFSLKHFPWRSRAHAEAKIRERLERRCIAEHAQGWGVHYDGLSAESAVTVPGLAYWRNPLLPWPEFLKLNLGCSDQMAPGFLNVDLVPPADLLADLSKPWPWPDGSADTILAHDFIEHLPDKVHTMNEAWRVLRSGGQIEIVVPTTDGRAAWQDPGHVSFFNRHSFWYFEAGNPYRERFCKGNGVKAAFKVLGERDISSVDGPKLGILLEAVK